MLFSWITQAASHNLHHQAAGTLIQIWCRSHDSNTMQMAFISVCIFHGNLNHVKSWFEIAKSRDHVKFRDVDPLPHGSNDKVWMVKEFKQTGRERTPSLTCFHIPSRNMPFNDVSQVFLQKFLFYSKTPWPVFTNNNWQIFIEKN